MQRCPQCESEMADVFLMIGGGIWLSESKERVARYMNILLTEPELGTHTCDRPEEPRLYCVVAGRGYRAGAWPIPGWRCSSCSLLSFRTKACWEGERGALKQQCSPVKPIRRQITATGLEGSALRRLGRTLRGGWFCPDRSRGAGSPTVYLWCDGPAAVPMQVKNGLVNGF